jgi:hypothetical protein
MYNEMLKHYTTEYEKFIELGLSKDDALTLVEKHIKDDTNIKKASPYDLINLFAGEDVWKNTFDAYQKELDNLIDKVSKVMNDSKEPHNCSCETCTCSKHDEESNACGDNSPANEMVTKVIADTPKHKEFHVTYPNGYYKYKMLMK